MRANDLETLIRRHGPGWKLLAAQWSSHPDDCVQEAILRLIRQSPTPDEPAAWVFRVVRNLALSEKRREQTRQKHLEGTDHTLKMWEAPDPSLGLQLNEIQEALNRLTDDLRTIVVARTWGELTFEAIGKSLGFSTSKVHRMYDRALTLLGEHLQAPSLTE